MWDWPAACFLYSCEEHKMSLTFTICQKAKDHRSDLQSDQTTNGLSLTEWLPTLIYFSSPNNAFSSVSLSCFQVLSQLLNRSCIFFSTKTNVSRNEITHLENCFRHTSFFWRKSRLCVCINFSAWQVFTKTNVWASSGRWNSWTQTCGEKEITRIEKNRRIHLKTLLQVYKWHN